MSFMPRTVIIAQLDGGLLSVPAQLVTDGESTPAIAWLTSVVESPNVEVHLLIRCAVLNEHLAQMGVRLNRITLHRLTDTTAEAVSQALAAKLFHRAELLHGPVSLLWISSSTVLTRRFCSSVRRQLGDSVTVFFHSTRPHVGLSAPEVDGLSDLVTRLSRLN